MEIESQLTLLSVFDSQQISEITQMQAEVY